MEEDRIRRIPPHNSEAEKSVIGSMLMSREAVAVAAELLTREDFYQPQYGLIFEAMCALTDDMKPLDVVTLQNKLKEMDAAAEVSDMEFLKDFLSSVPTSVNIREYATIVKEKATLRRLIDATTEISDRCYRDNEEAEVLLDETEQKIFRILQQRPVQDYTPIKEVVLDTIDRIELAAKSKNHLTGLPTGFQELDLKLSGLQNSDLILIAARPSMGKTAFALNIAAYMAFRQHFPVAVFSLEMPKEQLMNRLIGLESHVNTQNIRDGKLTDEDWKKIAGGANIISRSSLILDDTPNISLAEFRSKARKYKLDHDIKIIFIDYLQLMEVSGGRASENRQLEISTISRALKSLARELGIPVVALSQLNRSAEQREDHRPMLSDLRESGAIEQDADVVMFIYRDEVYNKDTDKKNVAEIIVAKQRNGPIGTVELVWLPDYTKFATPNRRGASRARDEID